MRIRSASSRPRASGSLSATATGEAPLAPVAASGAGPAAAPRAESRAGVAPMYTCARCGAAVRWREVKFCLDRRARFGGRVYCLGCQPEFKAA